MVALGEQRDRGEEEDEEQVDAARSQRLRQRPADPTGRGSRRGTRSARAASPPTAAPRAGRARGAGGRPRRARTATIADRPGPALAAAEPAGDPDDPEPDRDRCDQRRPTRSLAWTNAEAVRARSAIEVAVGSSEKIATITLAQASGRSERGRRAASGRPSTAGCAARRCRSADLPDGALRRLRSPRRSALPRTTARRAVGALASLRAAASGTGSRRGSPPRRRSASPGGRCRCRARRSAAARTPALRRSRCRPVRPPRRRRPAASASAWKRSAWSTGSFSSRVGVGELAAGDDQLEALGQRRVVAVGAGQRRDLARVVDHEGRLDQQVLGALVVDLGS